MKYIKLLNQYINLEMVAHYYAINQPLVIENGTSKNEIDYTIRFIFSGGATLTLQYPKKDDRDKDIEILDCICETLNKPNINK